MRNKCYILRRKRFSLDLNKYKNNNEKIGKKD